MAAERRARLVGLAAGGALAALGALVVGTAPGAGAVEPVRAQSAEVTFTRPTSEAQEIGMALGALPESMRPAATVYVLGAAGYRKAREGTSGVSCLLQRSRPDTQEPICWDREGSETILPLVLDEAAWRAAGVDEAGIARRVADGFASGKYRAPRRPGMSYMLSPHNYVFNGERVVHYRPHLMSYAPYLTNADIGTDGTDPSAPWILHEGSPHAYIIIPR